MAACSSSRSFAPPPSPLLSPSQPPQPTQPIVGVASWYGPGFDGHSTSTGEIYNQNDLTAASTMFPLGSRVMVTNLDNHRSVEVTINDRGPFVKGRKIDLSKNAARIIRMLDKGTTRVRIDLISAPPGSRPVGSPLRYYVQIGSFSRENNAQRLRERLSPYYRDVSVTQLAGPKGRYYRVRMGAFPTREQAQARASESTRFGLPIVIIAE